MAVKTNFSRTELEAILSNYALGQLQKIKPLTHGSVQTNLMVQTTLGKYVFRYYENRSREAVLFEVNLIRYLKNRQYPCAAPLKDKHGNFVGSYNQKPLVCFEFVEGQHLTRPTLDQKRQLIAKVAELHKLTRKYRPLHKKQRWNYSVELCQELARKEAAKLNSTNAEAKLAWLEQELLKLELPVTLPKGICHCDFHFANVLFKDGKFEALLDFDDANYTFLLFDLVGLIEGEAWQHERDEVLDFKKAKMVVANYTTYRALNYTEQHHLFDVYKLSILFDCVWYFGRGEAENFYERTKLRYLDEVGRRNFYDLLFS
jgi:homoserine kinase